MVSVTYGTQTFKLEGSGSSQVFTFDMQLNAAHAGGALLSFRFVIPVRPNLTYFGF